MSNRQHKPASTARRPSRRPWEGRPTGWIALAALLAAPWAAASAQQTSNGGPGRTSSGSTKPAAAVAVRALSGGPRVDGRLDDEIWKTAPAISDFTQQDPNQGEPPSERTEVRVVYTDAAIYVGVRAYDSQADQIAAQLTRRDIESPSDWILVGFDSYHDRRTAFVFSVNPAGVKRDFYVFNDNDADDSWDAVWDVACTRDPEGWTAEFRIPFSQLRFPNAAEHTFGFQVVRTINRLNEEMHWRLMPKEESGIVSRFGDLVGLQGIKPPRRVEVMPYVSGASTWEPGEDGNPFQTGSSRTGRAGADLNIGVTSNLTLSATINPDFGQVEADPAVVNLSAFETFFPEKRPFFNEGLDIFRFPILLGDGDGANEQLFYTRRIGRAPQGSADPRGGYAETVPQTTILSAAKLSGKTPSGWTIGLLGALTAEEEADVIDGDGVPHADIVEPRSTYFVGRLARDFRNGHTQVGFFGTAVNRALPDDLSFLRSSAYAGGFDWSHRFRNDTYSVEGWLVGSHVRGSEGAIERTQRSSARYYQRPDNDHVTLDPTRTSLSGFAGQLIFGKHAGGNWRFATGVDTRSPGFEVNDAGFQREADRTIQFLWIARRWVHPGKVFRRAQVNFNQWAAWSYGGNRLSTGGNVNANWQFLNYWSGYAGVGGNIRGLSTGALRGGPAFVTPGHLNGWAGFSTDGRKALRGGLSTSWFIQPEADTWSFRIGPRVSWRPASNMDFSFSPSLSRQFDSWQYLERSEVAGEDHFIFGELKQTTVNASFRGNVTFTPTLSLQVWAQPFVSTGDYEGFRQVADPRGDRFADRFDDFGSDRLIQQGDEVSIDLDRDGTADIDLGNPDFTVLSFRSNVVLRWEYLLGSTIFLVWQHGRFDYHHDGVFRLGDSLDDLFRLDATNTFVVKVNYWFSL
ncbi:MAG: hydrolase [Gemmatimonadales bacterium]|nr:hydrolase [Gemmatimonadales bacterium]NIN13002.1 hydrolase [Gemmatimonadales bacterium]NIN51079.1 hydrolase [Gemmatimonadales bacterium]NIP08543.1 hydrolase [Gemmatimonadales bacterium]NIR02261.1 hydrolase [Gemmatimonadales bacterium]